MDLTQLIYCINGAIAPSELTASAAKELSTQMPWANTFRQFYYVNLFRLDSPDYSKELTKGAILLSDRARFYQLTEGKLWHDWLQSWTKVSIEPAETIEEAPRIVEQQQTQSPASRVETVEPPQPLPSQMPSVAMAVDYLKFLEQQPSIDDSQGNKTDLIDHFLEYTVESKSWMNAQEMDRAPKQLPEIRDDAELDESFFTETLAQIYIKQHRYARALQIFKKLNLKYPEKSVYFASQIAQVESMIINNKQK